MAKDKADAPAEESTDAAPKSKEITIAGMIFPVGQPYAAGHVLTEGEAIALNQVRAENIRNNMAKLVKEKGAGAAEEVAEYDAAYEFGVRGEGSARVVDPLERECISIAKELLAKRIKEKGGKVKDYDKEAYAAKVKEWAANPKIIETAKANLAARKGLVDSLGDI